MDKSWKKMDNTVMGKNKDFHTSALPVGDSVRYSAQLPEPDWKSGRVAHKVCRPTGQADPPAANAAWLPGGFASGGRGRFAPRSPRPGSTRRRVRF